MFNISRITYYRHDNIMIQNTLSSKKPSKLMQWMEADLFVYLKPRFRTYFTKKWTWKMGLIFLHEH